MNILFIGATGLVGSNVTPILQREHQVTLAALGGGEINGSHVFNLDISDIESTKSVVRAGARGGRPFDAIVNCAIAARVGPYRTNPSDRHNYAESCIDVNARGAYHIYEAAARAGVQRVIYISSLTAVLGPPRHDMINTETHDRPRDVYAACKVFGEHVGRYYAYRTAQEGNSLQVVCLRLGQPYAGGETPKDVWTEPRRRLAVHTDDVAQAISLALNLPIQFATFPVVSDCDPVFIDPATYVNLGYVPQWCFSVAGIERLKSVSA
jgi:nucleoside-diphosphate-sugar epimerase